MFEKFLFSLIFLIIGAGCFMMVFAYNYSLVFLMPLNTYMGLAGFELVSVGVISLLLIWNNRREK